MIFWLFRYFQLSRSTKICFFIPRPPCILLPWACLLLLRRTLRSLSFQVSVLISRIHLVCFKKLTERGYWLLRDYNRILLLETKSGYTGSNVKTMKFPVLGGVSSSTDQIAHSGDLWRRSTWTTVYLIQGCSLVLPSIPSHCFCCDTYDRWHLCAQHIPMGIPRFWQTPQRL